MIKVILIFLLTSLAFALPEYTTPNIRPFNDSRYSKGYIYTKIIVGKFNEMRIDNNGKEHLHSGVDYALNKYTPIIATGGGEVIFAEWAAGYGNCIIIKHGELTTLYAHIQRFQVVLGDVVKRKDIIGYVGATGNADGNHIHYELRKNNRPIFPGKYFKRDIQ